MADENGSESRTIEALADDASTMPLQGSEQLSFEMGSEYRLADSTLRLAATGITIDGQFQEGDRVKLLVEAEVEYVSFPPIRSKGHRVGTERRHHAQVLWASQA